MSVASIPSPARGAWQLAVIPIRAYALCIVLGVLVAMALTAWRYREAGGQHGVIFDVAAWTVPFGLIGARLYGAVTDYQLYFGPHRDWTAIFTTWNSGIPGGLAFGLAGAWIACRRAGIPLAPVAGAAAPAVPLGQAIGRWANWFGQNLYGRPSSLPWAVRISPAHRVPGYESFATFQPAFLYECVWDLLVAAAVVWAVRRFALAGDRAFALYVASYAVGMFVVQTLRIDYSHHLFGLRLDEWAALGGFVVAVGYLWLTRARTEPGQAAPPHPAPAGTAALPGIAGLSRGGRLRPRSRS